MLTLALGKSEVRLAMRTGTVDMGLTVAEFTFLQLEEAFYPVPYIHKPSVFTLSFINILRQSTEDTPYYESVLQKPDDPRMEEYINQGQCHRSPQKSDAQLVDAVTSVHKSDEFFSEFHNTPRSFVFLLYYTIFN